MTNAAESVLSKITLLLDYRSTLDANSAVDKIALSAFKQALAKIAQLMWRMLDDPASRDRRLADIDLLLNDLIEDHPALSERLSEFRGKVFTVPERPSGDDAQDAIRGIIRILVGAGYLQENTKDLDLDAPSKATEIVKALPRTERVEERPSTNAEYTVWFGTNRKPYDALDLSKGYSADRDVITYYGTCGVFVPELHKIGSLGSPWWRCIQNGIDDRLRLLSIRSIAGDDYWQALSAKLAQGAIGDRHAVVFIHGYNVSFENAALRAAQIGFDLSIKGGMAFFSWPSQGTLEGYSADETTIEASEVQIADFMVDFVERSGAEAVHIMAHSMENRAVLRAVNRIAAKAERRTGKHFGQIILAAADIDTGFFKQMCGAYGRVADRTTLYVSARDRAVEASRWLHQFPRVGLMPPVVVAPGIDTINVTNVDMTSLGHGYVAGARDVLADMYDLITRNASPASRFGLHPAVTAEGDRYWIIRA